jgi:hypothetical protein
MRRRKNWQMLADGFDNGIGVALSVLLGVDSP